MLNPSQLFLFSSPSGPPFHLSGKRVPLGAQLLLLSCPFQDLYLISHLSHLLALLALLAPLILSFALSDVGFHLSLIHI